MTTILLGDREVGTGCPVYIVAELSANHGQRYESAVELVHVAADAGADAVKLQTYTADTLTIDADQEHFRIGPGTIWAGKTLHELYGEASTPWEWHPRLKAVAEGRGLQLFSSPFDDSAVDFLETIGVPAYKIASFELVDHGLIARAARTGQPLIMSTGMASAEEIDEAVAVARAQGAAGIALLKCTSAYPSKSTDMHLRTIPDLAVRHAVPVGLSDHTLGTVVPVAAVALGASIVEKHLCLSRAIPGPDSAFSLEPAEFATLVQQIRETEDALGEVRYASGAAEAATRALRRSLFVVRDVEAGERLSLESVRSIRPGHGLAPKHLPRVLGRRATRDLRRGTPLAWDDVADD